MSLWRSVQHSRHDARQVEDLRGEVGHVAVEEHEQRLDDARVRGEAGGEGAQQPVDGAHQDAAQRNHEEAGDAEEGVGHGHRARVRELLEQVVQNLREEQVDREG